MLIFWPYLNPQGNRGAEGLRLYALVYLLLGVGVMVFWLWWVLQPLPGAKPDYLIPTPFNITPMVYPGFEELFVLVTPTPPF